MVKNHSDDVLSNFLAGMFAKDMVEIRFEFEANEQWAVVSAFNDEDDSEISLRAHSGPRYLLYLGYYDDKDEFLELVQPLTADQVATIPGALAKLMMKVLDDEQGMRVPGNLLIR